MFSFAGILIGTLTMELGGKVTIACEKTGYKAELEFKLKVLASVLTYSKKGTKVLPIINRKCLYCKYIDTYTAV